MRSSSRRRTYDDPRIEWLAKERMPFVAFGRPWGVENIDDPERLWVDVDGQAGVHEATRHLIDRDSAASGTSAGPSAREPATTAAPAGSSP